MSSKIFWSSGSRSSIDLSPQNLEIRMEAEPRAAPWPDFILGTIPCSLIVEDLSIVRIQYVVPAEYELKLSGSSGRACAPSLGRFYVYLEAFHARLRLPLPVFIVALFHFLNIFLASIVPNTFRLIIGFLALYISAKV